MNKIEFFSTNINKSAVQDIVDVIMSERISSGKKNELFEKELSNKLNLPHPVTVNSGTSALFLALKALNLQPDDEVIIPAQTFIATGLAVLHNGAKAVFADINVLDGNISVESIKDKITNKTRCIIPVHWAGYPCDMDKILSLAGEHNIDVIEDAAHAVGAMYKNKPIGTLSRFTTFSFQAIKHLTTGDGGVICCKNESDYDLLNKLRWFNIDRKLDLPSILGEREYNSNAIGYKLHLNDLASQIGLCNLMILDDILQRHRHIANLYTKELQSILEITPMEYSDDRLSSYWLFPILVERRIDFINKLKSKGIPASVVHLGIDKNDIFGVKDMTLYNQRYFDENQIHIPINYSMTDEQVQYVIDTIKEGW